MKRRPSAILLAVVLVVVGLFFFIADPVPSYISAGKIRSSEEPTGRATPIASLSNPISAPVAERGNRDSGRVSIPKTVADPVQIHEVAKGKPIMKKMANETVRAELGRAAWKVFHTILSQYPEEPSSDAKETLKTYIYLFSRVYPCAECAEHFQQLLAETPPQLSSRQAAVMWGCDAHNKVNKRLGKDIFDCAYIFDEYDCGCGSPEDDLAALDAEEENTPIVEGG